MQLMSIHHQGYLHRNICCQLQKRMTVEVLNHLVHKLQSVSCFPRQPQLISFNSQNTFICWDNAQFMQIINQLSRACQTVHFESNTQHMAIFCRIAVLKVNFSFLLVHNLLVDQFSTLASDGQDT